MFLWNVTPDKIVQISRSLKQSYTPGLDRIDPNLAEISVPIIAFKVALKSFRTYATLNLSNNNNNNNNCTFIS